MKKAIIFTTIILILILLFLYAIDNEKPIGKSIKTFGLERIVAGKSVTIKTDINSPIVVVKKIEKKIEKYFLILQIDTLPQLKDFYGVKIVFNDNTEIMNNTCLISNIDEYPYAVIKLKGSELIRLKKNMVKLIVINANSRKLKLSEAFKFRVSVEKIINSI